jgi:O-succinylbenzoate synthase
MNHVTDREGALFKVTWSNGKVGYSDLMPRPELGDLSLDQELENLKKFKMSSLVEQMIALANRDADFRSTGKNAFQDSKKVKNSYFISEVTSTDSSLFEKIRSQKFSTLMIDCGQNFEDEAEHVRRILRMTNFIVRLDFNAKADFSILERFMAKIEPGLKPRIEYIEDPMPFEPSSWAEATNLAPLAIETQYPHVQWDNPSLVPKIKTLVIRPSRFDIDKSIKNALQYNCKMVVTSSLEHPVSTAHASLVASDLMIKYPLLVSDHDCLYQTFYAPHSFSGYLTAQGPYLTTSPGLGIGFDAKFKALNWDPL